MHSISRDLHLKWQFKKNCYFQLFKVNNVNSVVNKHTNWLEMGWTPYFWGCFPFNRTKRCRPSVFFSIGHSVFALFMKMSAFAEFLGEFFFIFGILYVIIRCVLIASFYDCMAIIVYFRNRHRFPFKCKSKRKKHIYRPKSHNNKSTN